MSAEEKATDDRPAALLPMNERRDMLFFLDMRDLLMDFDESRGRFVSWKGKLARPPIPGQQEGVKPIFYVEMRKK